MHVEFSKNFERTLRELSQTEGNLAGMYGRLPLEAFAFYKEKLRILFHRQDYHSPNIKTLCKCCSNDSKIDRLRRQSPEYWWNSISEQDYRESENVVVQFSNRHYWCSADHVGAIGLQQTILLSALMLPCLKHQTVRPKQPSDIFWFVCFI